MNKPLYTPILAAVSLCSLLGAAMVPNHISGTDTTFATKFGAAGSTEIALAKIALDRSKNPMVVSFAKKMIADHTKAGMQLMAIAKTKNVYVPTTPAPMDLATIDKLKSVPQAQFESTYRMDNVMGHQKAMAILNTEIDNGKDAKLVSFAKMTKPTVEKHQALVGKLPVK